MRCILCNTWKPTDELYACENCRAVIRRETIKRMFRDVPLRPNAVDVRTQFPASSNDPVRELRQFNRRLRDVSGEKILLGQASRRVN